MLLPPQSEKKRTARPPRLMAQSFTNNYSASSRPQFRYSYPTAVWRFFQTSLVASLMKRILGFGLLLALFCLPLLAAKNSQTALLPSPVRVGDVQLRQGHCDVTWTEPSGSQVQLTFKSSDKKTVTIPARVVQEKGKVGVSTFVKDGVTYLQELQT